MPQNRRQFGERLPFSKTVDEIVDYGVSAYHMHNTTHIETAIGNSHLCFSWHEWSYCNLCYSVRKLCSKAKPSSVYAVRKPRSRARSSENRYQTSLGATSWTIQTHSANDLLLFAGKHLARTGEIVMPPGDMKGKTCPFSTHD